MISRIFAAATVFLAAAGAPAMAQTIKAGPNVEIDGASGPVAVAAGEVRITGDISSGPVFAAGGDVSINADIDGRLLAFGGDVKIAGKAKSLSASGGDVTFAGEATGDAELAGGTVDISDLATVFGDLSAAAGDLIITGAVRGDATLAGGSVQIDGRFNGDVEIAAEEIVIGPNTEIGGDLIYKSTTLATIADEAQIGGDTVFEEMSASEIRRFEEHGAFEDFGDFDGVAGRAFGALFWFVASAASGALMSVLFPGWITGAAVAGRDQPLGVAATGLAVLLLTPVLAVLFMVIVIGLPIGLFLLFFWIALLFVSTIGAGFALGHLFFDRSGEDRANLVWFLAGLAIVTVVSAAPVIGWLIGFLAAAFGAGALSLSLLDALKHRQVRA